jgi:hypothetical protein
VAIPDPPDRGYDEHRARAALQTLVDSLLTGIRIITLDQLVTSEDGRDVQADLAIELSLEQNGDATVALFHWGVNFYVEQLCVWNRPLNDVLPHHAASPVYDLEPSWPGWPKGLLQSVEGFKLREGEVGLNRADVWFEHGGLRIMTGGLSGDEVDSLLLSPLARTRPPLAVDSLDLRPGSPGSSDVR